MARTVGCYLSALSQWGKQLSLPGAGRGLGRGPRARRPLGERHSQPTMTLGEEPREPSPCPCPFPDPRPTGSQSTGRPLMESTPYVSRERGREQTACSSSPGSTIGSYGAGVAGGDITPHASRIKSSRPDQAHQSQLTPAASSLTHGHLDAHTRAHTHTD